MLSVWGGHVFPHMNNSHHLLNILTPSFFHCFYCHLGHLLRFFCMAVCFWVFSSASLIFSLSLSMLTLLSHDYYGFIMFWYLAAESPHLVLMVHLPLLFYFFFIFSLRLLLCLIVSLALCYSISTLGSFGLVSKKNTIETLVEIALT